MKEGRIKLNNKIKISLLLGIMCMFLSIGIAVQIKTVSNSSTTIGKTLVENELRDSVLRWKQKYENAYTTLETKEDELNELRDKVSSKDSNYSGLSNKLYNYNLLLGNTEVVGKGVIVTLEDGDSTVVKGFVRDYIVHDGDILEIINSLKNAGAEAISVNGQRIVNTTSITCVGNVTMINGEKVGAPFVIKAIGSPISLYSSLKIPGGYLELVESGGVQVKVEQVDKDTIVIPKYDGVYKFKYASIYE